ncbi:MAG TPA: VOC family protein, partial [Sphingobium sp.]
AAIRQHRGSRMIHHFSVGTNDVERARAFYDPLMALLGYRSVRDHAHSLDYGVTDAVFSVETPVNGEPASCGSGFHVCFVAPDRDAVQASHRMALELGGRD